MEWDDVNTFLCLPECELSCMLGVSASIAARAVSNAIRMDR